MVEQTYCIAGRLRMLSRVVTGLYNDAFAPAGVTFAQGALLMNIFAQPGIRQSVLSSQLQIGKSALSRDIQLMQRNGWLTDNVRNGLFLTEQGTQIAKQCHKIWKVLNQQVRDELGADAIDSLTLFSDTLFHVHPNLTRQTPDTHENYRIAPTLDTASANHSGCVH